MLPLLGYLIIFGSVFGGFALAGGHLAALFQPIELLMIGGAALGSFVIANSGKVIKATGRSLIMVFKSSGYNKKYNVELLSLFFELTNKIRKDGAIAIESDIENYKESPLFSKYPLIQKDSRVMEFLCDNLRLIITGRVDISHLDEVMDIDIETFESEAELPINAINKVSDSMPAFGIVAAVMGVVHTMESIGLPPEELGSLIAKALVGTFLGVLFAYGFVAPLASSLDIRRMAAMKILHSIKVVLLASTSNMSPSIAVEMARKVLYSDTRPNSKELEELLKEIKSTKSGEGSNG